MADDEPLSDTPYLFAEPQGSTERELVAYIRREHRRGRHLGEILDDPHILKFGSQTFVWQTLRDTPLLELLDDDVRESLEHSTRSLGGQPPKPEG